MTDPVIVVELSPKEARALARSAEFVIEFAGEGSGDNLESARQKLLRAMKIERVEP